MKKTFLTLAIAVLISTISIAQSSNDDDKKFTAGNSLSFVMPQGDLGGFFDNGYGIYANFNYKLNGIFTLRGDFGYNNIKSSEFDITVPATTDTDLYKSSSIKSDSSITVQGDDLNVWEFTAGARASILFLYAEVRAGYFTGIDSFGYVPAVGVTLGKFDLQGSYAIVDDLDFASIRLAYYWAD